MAHRSLTTDVVVGKRGTILIPAEMRRALGICEGQQLLTVVEDGTILLRPVSSDSVERLRDAFAGVFTGVDIDRYISDLRDEWEP